MTYCFGCVPCVTLALCLIKYNEGWMYTSSHSWSQQRLEISSQWQVSTGYMGAVTVFQGEEQPESLFTKWPVCRGRWLSQTRNHSLFSCCFLVRLIPRPWGWGQVSSFDTPIHLCQTIQHHIQEDSTLHSHPCENLEPILYFSRLRLFLLGRSKVLQRV
jgi:hypothetical protein